MIILLILSIYLIITLLNHILVYIKWINSTKNGSTIEDFYLWMKYDEGLYPPLIWIPFINIVTFFIIIIGLLIFVFENYLYNKIKNISIRK